MDYVNRNLSSFSKLNEANFLNQTFFTLFPLDKMSMRFGSIIIHKPDPNSDGNHSSSTSSDEAEVAEVAEMAVQKYSSRTRRHGSQHRKRSDRQKRMAREQRSMGSRRSSSSSISSEVSILHGATASDKSPPLNRSHYAFPAAAALIEDRLKEIRPLSNSGSLSSGNSSPAPRRHSTHSVDSVQSQSNERVLGFRVLTVGSRTVDIRQRRASSASTDSHSSASSTVSNCSPVRESIFEEEEPSMTGLTKLLKNLNFAEKIRQQKAEQARLNIYKMPNHMKEQLKHIYVY